MCILGDSFGIIFMGYFVECPMTKGLFILRVNGYYMYKVLSTPQVREQLYCIRHLTFRHVYEYFSLYLA